MNFKGCTRRGSWLDFKALSQMFPGETEKTVKNVGRDSRCLWWDSNRQFPITGLTRLPQFEVTQFRTHVNLKTKEIRIITFLIPLTWFFFARKKAHWDESGGRILLGENRRRGGRAVADQIPVCWKCGFQLTYLVDRVYAPFRLGRSWTCTGLSGT